MLDHIEKIGELGELADVEPTAHVIAVENVLRADEPRPSLPAGGRAGERARVRHGRLPRSEPRSRARMSEALSLTAAAAAARIRAGELDAAELWHGYRERAVADDCNAFTWVAADGEPPAVEPECAARRRAGRGQGPVLHRGRPEPGRIEDPRGLPPALHRHQRRAARGCRRAAARQDEPGRVRDGLLDGELGLRPDAQPVGPHARAGRLVRRLGGGRRRRQRAVGDRHRHRRLDPPAGRALRDRRAQADLRRRQPLRHDRVRLLARPVRPVDARRHRRRAAARRDGRQGPVATRPRSACRAPVELPTPQRPARACGWGCRRS